MQAYRHYRLDGGGRISKAEWIEAESDDDVVRHVRGLRLRVASEVWLGSRRVARIDGTTE